MFYISQTQLDALSNAILDMAMCTDPDPSLIKLMAGNAREALAILVDIEANQPCQAQQILDAIIHLRAVANYAQFSSAMLPFAVTSSYALEKLHAFQDDPIRYFATLDTTNRQRFVNWILTSQPEGVTTMEETKTSS